MTVVSQPSLSKQPNTPIPFFKVSENFLSSALATMITKAVLQPIDTCKTRAQSCKKLGFRVGFVDILVDALKKETPMALFRGLPAAWLGSIPAQSLYISTYESCKYLFLEKTHFLPKNVGIALSAAIGDMVAGFIRVPPEIIKQRLQTGLDTCTSTAIRNIFQTQGLKGFYRGYIAQVSRDIPYAILLFLTYENAKYLFSTKRPMKARENFLRGALAGGVASFLTTPLDVVKTRVMTSSGHTISSYRFWFMTWNQLLKEEGWSSLWRGADATFDYTSAQSNLKSAQMSTVVDDFYRVKRLKYKGRSTAICLQNQNGPCPLLAIGSVDIHTDISYIAYQQLAELLTDYLFQTQSSASQDANLEQIVMDVVGVIPRLRTGIDVNVKFHSCDSFEYTVELSAFDAFRVRLLHGWIIDPSNALLASTIDGLSYNQLVDLLVTTEEVKASSGESWEPTHSVTELPSLEKETEDIPAQSVEGAAKEPFVETVNTEQIGNVAPVVASTEQHNLSENMEMEETKDDNTKDGEEAMTLATSCHQVSEIENIVSDKEATKMETETEATTNLTTQHSPRTKAAIIREFLTETSNQLTVYGLEELHKSVGEDELCVFFRNNHFSTITKHGGHLYLLISDIGFADEKDVIWEKICSIDGDSEFVNADFEPIQYGATRDSLPTTTTVGTSLDEQLAAQLQAQVNQQSNVSSQHMEDTDYQLAKKLQEEEQRKKPVTTNRKSPSRISSRTSPKTSPTKLSSSDRKSSGCSIQ